MRAADSNGHLQRMTVKIAPPRPQVRGRYMVEYRLVSRSRGLKSCKLGGRPFSSHHFCSSWSKPGLIYKHDPRPLFICSQPVKHNDHQPLVLFYFLSTHAALAAMLVSHVRYSVSRVSCASNRRRVQQSCGSAAAGLRDCGTAPHPPLSSPSRRG
ncbi:hypothetical protein BKA80DRAFT_107796 [Phyllosticta citrichinensis]